MSLFDETMIAFDILVQINKYPDKYTFLTRKGRHNLYDLACTLSLKKVKSLRGTFDQGRLLGFCIASEWDKKNKAFISQNADSSIHDLLFLNSFISKQPILKNIDSKYKNIESALLNGFKQGYLLGICYTNHQKNHAKPRVIRKNTPFFRYFKIPWKQNTTHQR